MKHGQGVTSGKGWGKNRPISAQLKHRRKEEDAKQQRKDERERKVRTEYNLHRTQLACSLQPACIIVLCGTRSESEESCL